MLSIDNVIYRIAGREILAGASARLPAGRRIGLVGRNGTGKSTLFKLILGELHLDGGEITKPAPGASARSHRKRRAAPQSLLDTVLEADPERIGLLAASEHRDRSPQAGRHPCPARSDRRLFRARARGLDSRRPRLFGRGAAAPLLGILRRLAHARGAGLDPVRRARSAFARRAHQLSRSRRRVVA